MKKRIVALFFIIGMVMLYLPQHAMAAEFVSEDTQSTMYLHSGSLAMEKLSQEEIIQLLEENSLNLPEELFEEQPSCTAPYATGKLKDEAIQVAVDRLNALRRLAGLPAVVSDAILNENAQYGAVILAVPGVQFGHYPEQPADMDDDFYAQAYTATSSSNIAGGTTMSGAVDAFMDDSDYSNVSRLGHRRWQLNPTMSKVGFGFAINEESNYWRYTTEKVFDRSGDGCDYDFVGWPASGYFPNSLFMEHVAWSVTLNPSKYTTPVETDVKVTLIREADGKVWSFDGSTAYTESNSGEYFNVETSGYGVANCIMFRPDGIETYEGVYTARIDGLKDKEGNAVTFAYQVEFFEDDPQPIYLTEEMFSIDTTSVEYDGTEKKKSITSDTLVENVDYVVEYYDNVNVGVALIVVTGIGNYTGTVYKEFTIEQATRHIGLNVSELSLYTNEAANKICVVSDNASAESPTYSFNSDNWEIVYVDYDGSLMPGTVEGTAIVTVTSFETANYATGTETVKVTVRNAELEVAEATGGSIVLYEDEGYVGLCVYGEVWEDAGYKLDTLSITDSEGKSVEVYFDNELSFYFYVPASDVRVVATFKKEEMGGTGSVREFVERMYTVALNRTADEDGTNWWTEILIAGNSDGAGLANGFLCGSEFTGMGYDNEKYVEVLYATFFDREFSQAELTFWIKTLEGGYTREYVLAGFVNSPEFFDLCASYGISRGTMYPNGVAVHPGIGKFAERLYTKVLERGADEEGVEYWTLAMSEGVTTPQIAAQDFFTSPEYLAKNTSNEEYIKALYRTFMDRECDADGIAFWEEVMNNGATRESVLVGFAESTEFQAIMEAYGL